MTPNQAPKPVKQKNAKAAAGKKQLRPKKPMPRFMVALLVALVFVLLLGAAGACVYLNVGGITPKTISFLVALNPEYQKQLTALEARQKALETKEKAVLAAQAKAEEQAKKADQANEVKASELAVLQTQLDEERKAFEDTKAAQATQEDQQKAIVSIYKNMDASTAADMLSKAPTAQEIADVLVLLDAQKAAEILQNMDAQKAYNVMKLMDQNQ